MKDRILELEKALAAKENELRKNKEILSLLANTSKAITSEVELEILVQRITDMATQLSGAEFGAFFYYSVQVDKEVLLHVISGKPLFAFNNKYPNPRASEIFQQKFEGLKTVRYDDVTLSPDFGGNEPHFGLAPGHLPVKSYLSVPVINPLTKKLIGGIFLGHKESAVFTEKEERIVEGIALQGAIAMGNARLFEEKTRAEKLLYEQTTAYKSILDATFDAVVILDKEGLVVEVNETATSIFGFTNNSIKGKHVKHMLIAYNPRFLSLETLRHENLFFQSQGVREDGKTLSLYCRARIFIYRNKEHILLNLKDISEQIKAEAALRRSNNFSDTITEASPVVLWLTNEFGELTYINPLWYKWTDASPDSQLGFNWIDYIHEYDRGAFVKGFRKSFQTKTIFEMDVRLNSTSGVRWINIHAEPSVNDEQFFSGMAGSMMDITIRKETQHKLQEKNTKSKQELEALVKARTIELEKINYELLQFSSIASHDLKEPVRKISVFSRLMQDRMVQSLDAPSAKYLNNIIQSSSRMMNLINDLLAFSRLSHVEDSAFSQIDLNEILRLVLQDLELAISEKKATINISSLPVISGIPVQMSQVFQNLISNSLKFRAEGRPVVINIETMNQDNSHFKIIYSDNGIGFNEAQKDRIFDVFQRLHPKDKFEGTGIGLSIVKKIINLHGGDVQAFGTEGKGARFEIILPYGTPSHLRK